MIREVKLEDYEDVKNLVYQVHKLHLKYRSDIYEDVNPLPKFFFEQVLNDDNSFNYVYVKDNKVVGFVMAIKKESGSNPLLKERVVYFIDDIVIDKDYRRLGIGKKLYEFIKNKALVDNASSLELNVWAFNKDALKFYEALGMKVQRVNMEEKL